jgi:hypothetical protein
MLERIAKVALWLDTHDMEREAAELTGVLCRYATDLVTDDGDDNDDSVEMPDDSWNAPSYHNETGIQAASPGFLNTMRQHNPEGYDWWTQQIRNKRPDFDPEKGLGDEDHTHTLYLGGRPTRVPAGFSNMSADEQAHFYFNKQQQEANEAEFMKRMHGITGGGKKRGTADIGYLSGSKPKSDDPEALRTMNDPRTYSFDPRAVEFMGRHWDEQKAAAEAQGKEYKTPDPRLSRMPAFDAGVMRQLFDPTDESGAELRAKLQGKPLATQLGHAFRGNMTPSKAFSFKRHNRQVDPNTGQKRKNIYLPESDLT